LLAISTGAVAVACASPPGGGAIRDTASAVLGAGTGQVTVDVDASPLQAERREVFLEHGGSAKIVGAVLEKLFAAGKNQGTGPYTVDVTVTGFRLRSSQTGFWFGFMAGVDHLDVSVSVVRNGAVEKQFQTKTTTAVAGLIRPGSVSRFDRLVNSIAERIVAGL
jgi:hypothetical protein